MTATKYCCVEKSVKFFDKIGNNYGNTGYGVSSLGLPNKAYFCIKVNILQAILTFLIARLARSDPRNHFVVVKTFFVPFAQILEYFIIL